MALAPAVAEIADVARLESDVFLAPAVSDRNTAFPLGDEAVELGDLSGYNFGKTAIAQNVDVKLVLHARFNKTSHERLQITDHLIGALVSDAHQDRRRGHDRLVAADAGCQRIYGGRRVFWA